MRTFVIGTRGSRLALQQAWALKRYVEALDAVTVEISVISTEGDRAHASDVALMGGKGVFVREIEEALAQGAVDCAVHSLKDVPVALPEGLTLACYLPREDPRDVLVSRGGFSCASLPRGSLAATSSPRRSAWIRHMRPDLSVTGFRGNVETRLRKLRSGEADVTFLAAAGLKRLDLWNELESMIVPLAVTECVPAPGQGTVAVEAREDDAFVMDLLQQINHREAELQSMCERACLAEFGEGSCLQPLGAYAELSPDGEHVTLTAWISSLDGKRSCRFSDHAPVSKAASLGAEAGKTLYDARAAWLGACALGG